MILETLDICGVLRFQDPVRLDLRELPPGLIAIIGGNGQGKTTLLESPYAALYRSFPSRERKLTDYATRPDGYIDIGFALDGQGSYRARVNLDHRGGSDAALSQVLPDGRLLPLNDGKLTTYDEQVRKLLPPPELVLASVFAAQNRAGSFARLDKKGRRELFESLLGMAMYRTMESRCKAAAAAINLEILSLEGRLDILKRLASDEEAAQLKETIEHVRHELLNAIRDRERLQKEVQQRTASLDQLSADAAAHQAAKADYDGYTRDLGRIEAQRSEVIAAISRLPKEEAAEQDRMDAAFESFRQRTLASIKDTSELTKELSRILAQEADVHADADGRIARNRETLLDRADDIRAAVTSLAALEQALEEKRATRDELRRRQESLSHRDTVQHHALQDVERAEADLARVTDDVAIMSDVPFGEDCAPCKFLANAVAAKARIPALQERVAARAAIDAELLEIERQSVAVAALLGTNADEIAALERDRDALKALADQAQNLALAEERIAGHERRKQDATAQAKAATAAAHEREDARVARLQKDLADREGAHTADLKALARRCETRAQDLAGDVNRLNGELADVQAKRASIEAEIARTKDASEQAAAVRELLVGVRERLEMATTKASVLETEQAAAEKRLGELDRLRYERQNIEHALAVYRAEHVEWITLQRAFSREGLPVIEIDNAGPEISALTNQLLEAAGVARFTVDLITQTAKASKGKDGSTMKETLEILVTDSQRGGEPRDLSDLSGGEYVFVDEAIKGAIAIYVNRRNPFPMRTLWRDETTGALDGENALGYMAMLRKLHELGGFHNTLFITHNPDAALLADAQVLVKDGSLAVQEPPYGVVA